MSQKEKPQFAYTSQELVGNLVISTIHGILPKETIDWRIKQQMNLVDGHGLRRLKSLSKRKAIIELLHLGDPVIVSAIYSDRPDFMGISEKVIRNGLNLCAKNRIEELKRRGTDKDEKQLKNLEKFQEDLFTEASPAAPAFKK